MLDAGAKPPSCVQMSNEVNEQYERKRKRSLTEAPQLRHRSVEAKRIAKQNQKKKEEGEMSSCTLECLRMCDHSFLCVCEHIAPFL